MFWLSGTGDLLGVWRDDDAATAFDGRGVAGIHVWRADLPGDASLARTQLDRSCAQLSEAASAAQLFPEPVEFAAGPWRDATGDLAGVLARACGLTAVVETSVGDELVGRSSITLRGDVRTVWRAGRGREDALLHQATVALALSTRATLLRRAAWVTRVASSTAVQLALPGGQLLALATAWRLIQRALSETKGEA